MSGMFSRQEPPDMCALILFHRLVPDFPVLLAANRDEFFDRPAAPPAVVAGRVSYLAPRDLRAGGTWIGTNAAGLVVGVTNRRERHTDPSLPSRGVLVHEALTCASVAAARVHLAGHLAGRRMNGFNLLLADAQDALLIRGGDRLENLRLDRGAHTITNQHELDELELLVVDLLAASAPETSLVETVGGLVEVLKGTEPVTADGFAPCKDHGDRGTRSSTIIARGEPGSQNGMFLHADGPPDRTVYEDYGHLLRALTP